MARCARRACGRWRPGFLVQLGGLGLCLDDAWYCSAQCLELAARERLLRTRPIVPPALPTVGPPRLGGVLATQKRLSPAAIEKAASEQVRSGLRIGSQLVQLGLVSKFDVLRALAAQGGVGFLTTVDPARLTAAPGRLSRDVVRALGLVPFEADQKHEVLRVACTAPVPRASIAALRELTGAIIEPYLVADEQWPALVEAYGASPRAEAPSYAALPDVSAVAAHVARAARHSRGVQMFEARCDGHLWVRLEGGGRTEELWVTLDPSPLAALTVAAEAAPMVVAAQIAAAAPAAAKTEPMKAAAPVVAAEPIVLRRRRVRRQTPKAAAVPTVPLAMTGIKPQAKDRTAADPLDLSFLEAWDAQAPPQLGQ